MASRTSEDAFPSQDGGKQIARNQTPSSSKKDERSASEKALEKINVAKEIVNTQKSEKQKSSHSVMQNLEGLVHVKPKQETAAKELIVQETVTNTENAPKLVRKAAAPVGPVFLKQISAPSTNGGLLHRS